METYARVGQARRLPGCLLGLLSGFIRSASGWRAVAQHIFSQTFLPPSCSCPAGPKACELPHAAAGRPAGAGNPEGQRLLNEAAAALRASHVEFAHQAHQDLTEVRASGGKERWLGDCWSWQRVELSQLPPYTFPSLPFPSLLFPSLSSSLRAAHQPAAD